MFNSILALFVLAASASAQVAVTDIYEGCGDTKQCYGYFFSSCVDTLDCDMIATWRQETDTTMTFEVQAANPSLSDPLTWIAVGFSRDNTMGEDSAFITSQSFAGEAGNTRLYWNFDNGGGDRGTLEVGDNTGIQPVTIVNSADGEEFIYASFVRDVRMEFLAPKGDPPVPTEEVNDLSAEDFYLLVATGPIGEDSQPDRHQLASSSVEPFRFTEVSGGN